eukprot:CAMPEP_0117450206 /NCGR_PEP_ID=MMETSP0759-20121206/8346_1 /TAXON_ID=63605 /ORGANISM="Percolomonas cosmopolitus, Strain WS" /LENGTH=249 /DNA_ID=CAMNT_0005242715 /DNA_START=620 /DNA_END=1369 /DNA_ORIENTATION=-
MALMKFGIGQWSAIIRSGILPGKAITQITVMTQRILGQQSLGGLVGLHVDVDDVREWNEERFRRYEAREAKGKKLKGSATRRRDASDEPIDDQSSESEEEYEGAQNIMVKNGMIVNKGNNPTKESKLKEFLFNKDKFDLDDGEVRRRVDEFALFSLKRERRLMFNEMVQRVMKHRRQQNGSPIVSQDSADDASDHLQLLDDDANQSEAELRKEEKILELKESLEQDRKRLRDLEEELLTLTTSKRRKLQ